MGKKNKKMAVFELLQSQIQAISLQEILKLLDSGYSERSLRRWLSEWISEGLISKIGQGPATRYLIPKYQVEGFTEASQQSLQYIARPLHQRKPVAYCKEWLKNYQPNKTNYLSQSIKNQLHKIGKRSKDHEPAGTYAQHIYNRLLVDLSYNSSRLEGNTYSLAETQKLILTGESPEGKLDIEKMMILNHKEAIRYLVEHARKIEISEDVICTIHFLLSGGLVEKKDAGNYRSHSVRIGGSAYLPFENPNDLKKQMSLIVNKAQRIQDPFELSVFLLAHLSYLQAFADVNKRTARLCANIPFIKQNLVPCSFNDIDKDEYLSAIIAIYELNALEPLIDLYVYSYKRTCQMYDATIEALGFDEIHVRYRHERRAIMRYIIENRVIGKDLDAYVQQEAEKHIKEKDLAAFISDVHEDLKLINPIRIAGLGVTKEQLEAWIKIAR